jgi:hypothetical protein
MTRERQTSDRPDPDEPHTPGAAAARLAAALGWEGLPVLIAQQERIADEKFAAAQAEADLIYGTAGTA